MNDEQLNVVWRIMDKGGEGKVSVGDVQKTLRKYVNLPPSVARKVPAFHQPSHRLISIDDFKAIVEAIQHCAEYSDLCPIPPGDDSPANSPEKRRGRSTSTPPRSPMKPRDMILAEGSLYRTQAEMVRELTALREESSRTKGKLAQWEVEREALMGRIARDEAKISSMTRAKLELEARRRHLGDELDASRVEHEATKEELEELQKLMGHMEHDAEIAMNAVHEELRQASSARDDLTTQVASLMVQLGKAKRAKQELESVYERECASFASEEDLLRKRLDRVSARESALEAQLAEAKSLNDAHLARIEELSLIAEEKQMVDNKLALLSRTSNAHHECDDDEKHLPSYPQSIGTTTDLLPFTRQLSSMQEHITAQKRDIAERDRQITVLLARIERAHALQDKLLGEMEGPLLKAAAGDVVLERDCLREQLSDLKSLVMLEREASERSAEETTHYRVVCASKLNELNNAASQLRDTQNELLSKKSCLEESQREVDNLKSQIKGLNVLLSKRETHASSADKTSDHDDEKGPENGSKDSAPGSMSINQSEIERCIVEERKRWDDEKIRMEGELRDVETSRVEERKRWNDERTLMEEQLRDVKKNTMEERNQWNDERARMEEELSVVKTSLVEERNRWNDEKTRLEEELSVVKTSLVDERNRWNDEKSLMQEELSDVMKNTTEERNQWDGEKTRLEEELRDVQTIIIEELNQWNDEKARLVEDCAEKKARINTLENLFNAERSRLQSSWECERNNLEAKIALYRSSSASSSSRMGRCISVGDAALHRKRASAHSMHVGAVLYNATMMLIILSILAVPLVLMSTSTSL